MNKISRNHIFEILDSIEKECNEERLQTGENAYGLPETLAWRHKFVDEVMLRLRDVHHIATAPVARSLTDEEWKSGTDRRPIIVNDDLANVLKTSVGSRVTVNSSPFKIGETEFVHVTDGTDRALATRDMLGVEL